MVEFSKHLGTFLHLFHEKPWGGCRRRKKVHTFWMSGDLEILRVHGFYLVHCSFHINVLSSNVSHTDSFYGGMKLVVNL